MEVYDPINLEKLQYQKLDNKMMEDRCIFKSRLKKIKDFYKILDNNTQSMSDIKVLIK